MGHARINEYYNNLDRLIQYGGGRHETAIRGAFYTLLNSYARDNNLELVPETTVRGSKGKDVRPDGVLKNALRLDFGYWESKDETDDLNEEIEKKFAKGYPNSNILFEDTSNAVLIQHGAEIMRADMRTPEELDKILRAFVHFEHTAVRLFNEALVKFKTDIPTIVETLREKVDSEGETNERFRIAREKFLEVCRNEINPDVTDADVREMLIQHLLTADIFNVVFDEADFHRHNSIARELEDLISTFLDRSERRNLLGSINHYYEAINAAAASIADHHEKQKFLKSLYENFYKAYNPKAADRLGVVYTPNEIVRFKIESVEYLLQKHFGKSLCDRDVEILDPANGTGTYICELIDFIPKQYLEYKYKNELHANEVAILPYYIANLNIEFTYKQKMGKFEEFKNLCFVDTLENLHGLNYEGQQLHAFGLSTDNADRIKRQNERKISVIICNPPYNANQQNENDNNKNRVYPVVDRRIKDTYIKKSTAQKTKLYDMYSRFFRWASDRLDERGVIAFITNRSFIESRTFDGFRACIDQEFDFCYIIDTKSDVRANPNIAGTTHNVFGIQTGVAVMFLIRSGENRSCRIQYSTMNDDWPKEQKLRWFKENLFQDINFSTIIPDSKHNWLNQTTNDWNELLPLCSSDVKTGKSRDAIFEVYTLGISTNRDEWVTDNSETNLAEKIEFFISEYDKDDGSFTSPIKWSEQLKRNKNNRILERFNSELITVMEYRPFTRLFLYRSNFLIDRLGQTQHMFAESDTGIVFRFGDRMDFFANAVKYVPNLNFYSLDPIQCVTLNRYVNGNRVDNVTDWALSLFENKYGKNITKKQILYYVYSVLHHSEYRKKYAVNLKHDFPRIPLYEDFAAWSLWGKKLIDLHLNYETQKPTKLTRIETDTKEMPRVKLKAIKADGVIIIDENTELHGIPGVAWEYKLGNRSALEWVLDQYKEKSPKDPTIREKFNAYKFANYKDQVISLLSRVCTVSVATVAIVEEMTQHQ